MNEFWKTKKNCENYKISYFNSSYVYLNFILLTNIINMKIITESKHSITLRTRTLFGEIATNKLEAIELKIRYYELVLLN